MFNGNNEKIGHGDGNKGSSPMGSLPEARFGGGRPPPGQIFGNQVCDMRVPRGENAPPVTADDSAVFLHMCFYKGSHGRQFWLRMFKKRKVGARITEKQWRSLEGYGEVKSSGTKHELVQVKCGLQAD